MTVSIEVSEEQVAAWRATATVRGLSLEDWLRTLAVEDARSFVAGSRKGRHSLAELVAQCDPAAERSNEDREWLQASPVGREAL